jgi:hypothetical protein
MKQIQGLAVLVPAVQASAVGAMMENILALPIDEERGTEDDGDWLYTSGKVFSEMASGNISGKPGIGM